jgi:hypothetical protein
VQQGVVCVAYAGEAPVEGDLGTHGTSDPRGVVEQGKPPRHAAEVHVTNNTTASTAAAAAP